MYNKSEKKVDKLDGVGYNISRPQKENRNADMAELADAYGSGPYESNFMQVQVLLSAPNRNELHSFRFFSFYEKIFPPLWHYQLFVASSPHQTFSKHLFFVAY